MQLVTSNQGVKFQHNMQQHAQHATTCNNIAMQHKKLFNLKWLSLLIFRTLLLNLFLPTYVSFELEYFGSGARVTGLLFEHLAIYLATTMKICPIGLKN